MKKCLYSLFLLTLFSCVSHPNRLAQIVKEYNFNQTTISGTQYQHLLISNNILGKTLHVYIEGDGLPWLNRYTISKDPTPKNPLALKLMSQDTNYAIYLGRPCYFGHYASKKCSATQWTNGRYGEDIIQSMQNAIHTYITRHKIENVVLIGYSGGGVIASLLAHKIPQTEFYVTIAANLDIDAWTNHHQYSKLDRSLNPANIITDNQPPAIHLIGQKDRNVPAHLNQKLIKRNKGTSMIIPNYNHICCWENDWNNLLKEAMKQRVNSPVN